ncbi:MAG: P1 family peptidase [Pseudomonadota bacterium]
MQTGQRNLITDVTGLLVGQAEDTRLKTGVSVVLGEAPFVAGVHVMGGAPGTRETDLLAPDKLVERVDALVLAGGSAFGLEAAAGVTDALRADGRGFAVGDVRVPIVPGAIIFDLLAGGAGWQDNPFKQLGAEAYAARQAEMSLGSAGAGTGATTAGLKGGVGSASVVLPDGITVGALAVVNALGSAVVGDGPHFWAAPFEIGAEFGGLGPAPVCPDMHLPAVKRNARSTTIAVVATDAALNAAQCTRMAVAAHDGMARALIPSHTPMDGDLVFAAATGLAGDADPLLLGHVAATCLSRAIARGVHSARPAPGDVLPCWSEQWGRPGDPGSS